MQNLLLRILIYSTLLCRHCFCYWTHHLFSAFIYGRIWIVMDMKMALVTSRGLLWMSIYQRWVDNHKPRWLKPGQYFLQMQIMRTLMSHGCFRSECFAVVKHSSTIFHCDIVTSQSAARALFALTLAFALARRFATRASASCAHLSRFCSGTTLLQTLRLLAG